MGEGSGGGCTHREWVPWWGRKAGRRLRTDAWIGRRSKSALRPNLRAECPSVPVLMLSMHAEEQYAIRCLRAGASGYIQKDSSPEELIEAIERVAMGRR